MRITSHLFDAFLKCPTKCHLRSLGEIGSGNEYAEWIRGQNESYQREAARRLQEAVPEAERVVAPPATENLKAAKWRLAVDLLAQTPDRLMDSSIGTDAMLTDHEPSTTHPSPCPLPATRGEDGRRSGEGRFIESDDRKRGPNEETRGLDALYDEILRDILKGPLLHIDETTANLHGQIGYVWVMATVDKVYYFYKPSREGSFLRDLLAPFSGVLVSDFFTAYDSLSCQQQKCLAHLVRDIDDDLLRNPLDGELRTLAQELGVILRSIIQTIDRFGLKKRHLHQHKKSVARFLKQVNAQEFSSELAVKYQKRFEKSGPKMFTFLDHDGVPWNNTNAEHAIKRFAKYRKNTDGYFTERSLKEYLILASVLEICEFNNVNVLKFLLSREMTLEGLLRMSGRKRQSQTSLPAGLPADASPAIGSSP